MNVYCDRFQNTSNMEVYLLFSYNRYPEVLKYCRYPNVLVLMRDHFYSNGLNSDIIHIFL